MGVLPTLKKLTVISARSKFQGEYPPREWKVQAFLEVQQQFNAALVTNLIAIGDSPYEMDAVAAMGTGFDKAFVKKVKFKEHPSPQELAQELEILLTRLPSVLASAENLKVQLCQSGVEVRRLNVRRNSRSKRELPARGGVQAARPR